MTCLWLRYKFNKIGAKPIQEKLQNSDELNQRTKQTVSYTMFMDKNISILHNVVYRFNVIPINIPAGYSMDIDKLILKFIWRNKKPRIDNTI